MVLPIPLWLQGGPDGTAKNILKRTRLLTTKRKEKWTTEVAAGIRFGENSTPERTMSFSFTALIVRSETG